MKSSTKTKQILFVVLIGLLSGCQDKPDIKVNAYTETKQRTYEVGDTLYFEYGWGNAMFIIEKIDIEQKVFVGRKYNTFDLAISDKYVLPFSEYLDNRF